jgi:outer membrane protein OmpA-like peptidoglycan-associated protein
MKQLVLILLLVSGVVATAQQGDPEVVSQQYNLQELTIVKLKKGDRILLENLIFRGGTSFLEKESKPLLEELLEVMQNNPRLKIEIQGHVCCYPNRTNKLSKERAKVVYEYLIDNGIPK